jgi:secreted PhoX family phosphatase
MEVFAGNRRDFLKFAGRGSAFLLAVSCAGPLATIGLANRKIKGVLPSIEDQLKLAESFDYKILISWDEVINTKGERFGYNNDFLAFVSLDNNPNEGLLWVNHEYVHPLFVSGHVVDDNYTRKTKDQAQTEMKAVGGSIIHIKKIGTDWTVVKNSSYNRRLDGFTPIPFSKNTEIFGSKMAIGTLANCAGGVTPWNTFLSCEENYQNFFGEALFEKDGNRIYQSAKWVMGWDIHYSHPPEHYGWVVEINPKTGEAKKLVSLGRFCHEGACTIKARDGRVVVYMGDDSNDEGFYKFISDTSDSLESGTLYVAQLETGRWLPLDIKNPLLKNKFKNQTELLIRTREAAKIVGATKMDRPEDCEIDPISGHIFLNCTNNVPANRPYGSIYKFVEKNNDYTSLEFTSSIFIHGGDSQGIACPDNMAFDKKGNLWVTNDISEDEVGNAPYKQFGNNALFYIPMSGKEAGVATRVAQAPMDAEFTGPCFSPDGKTLFLSVQHPGAKTVDLKKLTGHWPNGGNSIPRPSVVAIKIPDDLL